jgi:hypothetical protein
VTDQSADDVFAAAVEHRRAQIENWSQWVAAHDILTPDGSGILMFVKGTPVPVEHVEKFGWDKEDPPQVISREQAEKDGLALDAVPSVSSEEAILDGVTAPPQGAEADTGEQPKGPSSTKSTSKPNKSSAS